MFGDQTPSDIVWWPNILPFRHLVWCYLIVFVCVWSCLVVFDKIWRPSTIQATTKTFLLYTCLMGDLFFVWTAAYQTCLKRACVPRLLSALYQLFDLCLIKHVLIVWPRTWTLACLVTKQCLMVFGRQTFIVCPGPKTFLLFSCLMGDVLFIWTAACQTYSKRACVPRLLRGLYQLFHLCLIKHVLTVSPLTSTLACLVKTIFDGVWSPNISRLSSPLQYNISIQKR